MKLKKIKLKTPDPEQQWAFYTQVLGFEGEHLAEAIQLRIGESILAFSSVEDESHPYYHFAFNIPYNQFQEALDWLKSRVEVLQNEEGSEIVDFVNWNAYAIYFFDPAGNIVEFIAREDVPVRSQDDFSAASVISISEIGIAVADVAGAYEQLKNASGVPVYKAGSATFCPAGNPEGLFIIVDESDKIWYPTEKPALSFPLEAEFEQGGECYTMLSGKGTVDIQFFKEEEWAVEK